MKVASPGLCENRDRGEATLKYYYKIESGLLFFFLLCCPRTHSNLWGEVGLGIWWSQSFSGSASYVTSVLINPVFLREGQVRFASSSNSPHFSVTLSGFKVACFLVIADAHLLTGCMALQTARSVMIAVCESQLAWAVWHCRLFAVCKGQLACRRCSPSILKKWNLTNLSS